MIAGHEMKPTKSITKSKLVDFDFIFNQFFDWVLSVENEKKNDQSLGILGWLWS